MKKNILEKTIYIVFIITFILDFFFNKNSEGYYLEHFTNIIYILSAILLIYLESINENIKKKKESFKYYFILYITLIIYLTFNRFWNYQRSMYNLIPFNTILYTKDNVYILTLILNFLLYMPFAIILPNISDRLKSNKNYIITIIFMSIILKGLGYIFHYSVLDIDDIILNITGSTILFLTIKYTKLNKIVNKILFNIKLKDKINNILYIVLYVIFIILSLSKIIGGIVSIVNLYYRDFSHFKCYSKEKTYITTIRNDKYYSECNYKDSYIIAGNIKYTVPKYVESWAYKEKDNNKLYIIKEKIIDNVMIYKKENSIKKISNYNKMIKMFLVNIDYITLTKNNINYKIEDEKDNDINFHNLVNPLYSESKSFNEYWYTLNTGYYFNIIQIHYLNDSPSYEFIIPKDYKINQDKLIKLYEYAKKYE